MSTLYQQGFSKLKQTDQKIYDKNILCEFMLELPIYESELFLVLHNQILSNTDYFFKFHWSSLIKSLEQHLSPPKAEATASADSSSTHNSLSLPFNVTKANDKRRDKASSLL